jgi:hypothetical protein
MPPLPPPDPSKRRGKRTVRGSVPPPTLRERLAEVPMVPPPASMDEPDWRLEASSLFGRLPSESPAEIPYVAPRADEALTDADRELLQLSLAEIARRESEALRLFKPMPEQERFFASEASERVALGGNRGGKTTVTCVEIARALTGQDPYKKYPEKDGRFIIVGRDLKHCSKVFFEKLFMPGSFKVIRDKYTGEWRSYNPQHPDDIGRSHEAKKAPPLIPKRFYDQDSIAWENKKESLPTTVKLYNGWELYFFSSKGIIPQGWDVDGVCFDEEIEVDGWYTEMAARLLDRRKVDPVTGHVQSGKFLWSATPQAGTQQLYDLKCRADQEREGEIALMERGDPIPRPSVEVFTFGLLDNSYMSVDAINELINKYSNSPEEYEVRIKGNFALLGSRVYGEFMPKGVHGTPAIEIGSDWTRYVAIDPGHQVCALLFCAVPPPGSPYHGQKIIYDELYIKKCNAPLFAEMLKRKMGHHSIRSFIIDHRAGRQHDMTSGRTNEENYSAALKAAKVECETTGNRFTWGSDDPKAGIEAVRTGLHIHDGRTEWLVVREKCPWLCWEMDRYSYRRNPDKTPTDEPIKINDHLCDCWRYLAMANLKYVPPRIKKRKLGYTSEAIKQKKDRAKAKGVSSGASGVKVY